MNYPWWVWLIQGAMIGYCAAAIVAWREGKKRPQKMTGILPRTNGIQWFNMQDRAKTSNTWSNEVNDLMGR
jgi:hypothetical protein